VTLTLQDCF